ncbi:hypothetical protein K492DRAFT_198879 [Lichtheimia hyalospora FSU 10163]|nr:hypothetical protein K492DRAFT_198879 [Lichtheimia hyalospora FSU 10163]
MAGIALDPFGTVENNDQLYAFGWMSLQESDLGRAISNWCRHWSHSNLPREHKSSSTRTDALDGFSPCQYLCVYSLVKAWIICAYAICDA